MNATNELSLSRLEKITLQGVVVCFWLSAFMVRFILDWFQDAYNRLGTELPTLTGLFLQGIGLYSSFILAFLLSVFEVYQIYQPHARTLLHGLWALSVWAVYLVVVLCAVGLPFFPPCAPVG